MTKITLKIDGMACEMCEAHINDAVRKAFKIKKVTSYHRKGTTEIIAESKIDEADLKNAVEATGYRILSVSYEPYEKKGLFSFFK
ncbi:MAG: heavy-metal-associated domain-containing protein [Eubacterium sp.]